MWPQLPIHGRLNQLLIPFTMLVFAPELRIDAKGSLRSILSLKFLGLWRSAAWLRIRSRWQEWIGFAHRFDVGLRAPSLSCWFWHILTPHHCHHWKLRCLLHCHRSFGQCFALSFLWCSCHFFKMLQVILEIFLNGHVLGHVLGNMLSVQLWVAVCSSSPKLKVLPKIVDVPDDSSAFDAWDAQSYCQIIGQLSWRCRGLLKSPGCKT